MATLDGWAMQELALSRSLEPPASTLMPTLLAIVLVGANLLAALFLSAIYQLFAVSALIRSTASRATPDATRTCRGLIKLLWMRCAASSTDKVTTAPNGHECAFASRRQGTLLEMARESWGS